MACPKDNSNKYWNSVLFICHACRDSVDTILMNRAPITEKHVPSDVCSSPSNVHGLDACKELNINPTITVIVVGKRHHVRFFAQNPKDADRKSGNCPAGTVVDRDIGHPTEF